MNRLFRVTLPALALVCGLGFIASATADGPLPISPGGVTPPLATRVCPTFSWGAAAGALGYELAIYPEPGAGAALGEPLVVAEIDAPALSWTPSGEYCLEPGQHYLWYVRGRDAAGTGAWSPGLAFELSKQDQAVLEAAVRQEVAARLNEPETWRSVVQTVLGGDGASRLRTTYVAAAPVTSTERAPAGGKSLAPRLPAGPSGSDIVVTPTATTFPNPSAFKINSANGVVFNDPGTNFLNTPPGSGGIPAEGSGTRLMWYPGKAAFRVGAVGSTNRWDDANIGSYSMGMGWNAMASGSDSIAIGYAATASGERGTALGNTTTASGFGSTAMGSATIASGGGSTAMGSTTTASGLGSIAMGYRSIASGVDSVAIGVDIGSESANEMVIGRYDTDYIAASPTEWNSNDRLFVIGNGTASGARSDALVVLKNGNVGIGQSAPTFKLQLATDSAAKPGTTTWTVASDGRLKTVEGEYKQGLEAILGLRPVKFRYAEGNARGYGADTDYVGFVAQEVHAVFPEAVTAGKDGYLDFNMHAVNVALVNALKEQQAQIEAQRRENLAQRDEIQTLKTTLQGYQDLADRLARLEGGGGSLPLPLRLSRTAP